MNRIPFDSAKERLESAQRLLSELRKGPGSPGSDADLAKLDELLGSVAQSLAAAKAVCDRQAGQIDQLSSMVVGSTARHF